MTATPKSVLHRYLPWPEVARLLEIPLRSQALPVLVQCPLCHAEALRVYDDRSGRVTSNGEWAYCSDCHFSGDTLELCAAAWNVSIEDAVARLDDNGLPMPESADVNEYHRRWLDRRRRISELWAKAREAYAHGEGSTTSALRHLHRINCGVNHERWMASAGHLLGSAHRMDVEHAFNVATTNLTGRQSIARTDVTRFKGRGWGDVILMPFWDMPGRVCAFQCVGRRGTRKEDMAVACVRTGSSINEGGLHGLPLMDMDTPFGLDVVAMNDAMMACRLQVKHCNVNSVPLPIVTWQDNETCRTKEAWSALEDRRVTFWMPEYVAQTFVQAVAVDGRISLSAPVEGSGNNLLHYTRNCGNPFDFLKRVLKSARPWREVLTGWLLQSTQLRIQGLCHVMEARSLHPIDVANELKGEAADLLVKVAVPKNVVRTRSVKIGRSDIVEKADGWYLRDKQILRDKPVTNFVLRLDRIVPHPDGPRYEGRVLFGRKSHDFSTAASMLSSTNTAGWIENFLRCRGEVAIISRSWSKRLVDIATLFQRPENKLGD